MTPLEFINGLVVAVGLPILIGWLINIGRKLQTLDWLAAEIRDSVRPDIKDVRERLSLLEGKTASLFGSSSPLQLRQSGRQLLESSGLKRYIDSNKDDLLEAVFNAADSQTEYDIQAASLQILNELDFDRPLQGKIKQAAFNSGISQEVVLLSGAIYLRDLALAGKSSSSSL